MNEDNIFETEAIKQAEELSLAFERDSRRYSNTIDYQREAGR